MKICSKTSKVKYKDEKKANSARMRMWGRDPSVELKDLHAYKCEHCGLYHIGHLSYYLKTLGGNIVQKESV